MQLLVNGTPLDDLPEGAVLTALIERMQLGGKRVAIELNGEIITRSAHAQTQLHEGDRVEIVQAIGGG